jgi:hypothetical protein
MLRRRAVPVSLFSACGESLRRNERINGPASRNLLGGQTMGCHRLWHPGVRSEAEGQIRYRSHPAMGRRRAGRRPRAVMAQRRGLRQCDLGCPQVLPGAARICRAASEEGRAGRGERSGPGTSRPEGTRLERVEFEGIKPEGKPPRGAETRGSNIRYAD